MRPNCLLCTLKHLGDAVTLWYEIQGGYEEEHIALFIGALSQAEQESAEEYPEIAETLVQERRAFLDSLLGYEDAGNLYEPDLLPLIKKCLEGIRQAEPFDEEDLTPRDGHGSSNIDVPPGHPPVRLLGQPSPPDEDTADS